MVSNYKKPLTLSSPIDLADLAIIPVEGISGIKFAQETKKVYQAKEGSKWMVDCGRKGHNQGAPSLESYVIGGLYKLVLDEFAPNEQLFRDQDKNICLGSEFIEDFIEIADYSELMISKVDYNYFQRIFQDSENGQLLLAIMILMGEKDANTSNLGVVTKEDGRIYLSKIDHDHSKSLNSFLFKSDVFGLNSDSSGKVINPLYDKVSLAKALKVIDNIPDEVWKEVIQERVKAYHKAMGTDYNPDAELPGMAKKANILHYINSLEIDNAIENGDIKEIEQLVASGVDLNKKYFYLSSGKYIDPETMFPIEIAASYNKLDLVKYFYNKDVPSIQLQKSLLSIASAADNYELIKLIMQHESFGLSDKACLGIAISSSNIVMLEFMQEQNKAIDLSSLEYAHFRVLVSDNVLAYKIWVEQNSQDINAYIADLKKLLLSYGNAKKLITFLIDMIAQQVTSYEDAAKLMEIITKEGETSFFFKDHSTKAAALNLFTHYFRSDEEIVDYVVKQHKRNDFSKTIFEYTPYYILEISNDPKSVLKSLEAMIKIDLRLELMKSEGDVYEFFLKNGLVDSQKFTLDAVKYFFSQDCSDLLMKMDFNNNNNRLEIYENDIKGDVLRALNEIVVNSGVHFNISTMHEASSLFFQAPRIIEYSKVDKFIELFISTSRDNGEQVCIESNQIILDDSVKFDVQEFIKQCHETHQIIAPEIWSDLSVSIAEDRVIIASENVISEFVIDVVGGNLLHAECSII